MAEPRKFATREQLDEYFNLHFSRLELEPSKIAKQNKHAELCGQRDDALLQLGRDLAKLDMALTPVTPPRSEPPPLPDEASESEKAERLYGNAVMLVGGTERLRRISPPIPSLPATPGDDMP
ncbi:MAG: hypothetical protein ACHQ01_09640 [Candidatus Limnocylindrales bacterium]